VTNIPVFHNGVIDGTGVSLENQPENEGIQDASKSQNQEINEREKFNQKVDNEANIFHISGGINGITFFKNRVQIVFRKKPIAKIKGNKDYRRYNNSVNNVHRNNIYMPHIIFLWHPVF